METEELEGEPSTVEITMDTFEMDTMFQVEASNLPQVEIGVACCNHLFSIEHKEALWKLSALRYLNGADKGNQVKRQRKIETRAEANASQDCGTMWESRAYSLPERRRTSWSTQATLFRNKCFPWPDSA